MASHLGAVSRGRYQAAANICARLLTSARRCSQTYTFTLNGLFAQFLGREPVFTGVFWVLEQNRAISCISARARRCLQMPVIVSVFVFVFVFEKKNCW